MKWITNIFKKLIKRKLFWLVLVIVIIIAYFIIRSGAEADVEYVTEKVQKITLTQTVSETGSVKSTSEITLNFKGAGELVELNVKEGSAVTQGDVLARLDGGPSEIQVRQAKANVDIARANLNRLLAGASDEDLKVSEESVNNAKIAYENAKRDNESLLKKIELDTKTFEETVVAAEKALNNSTNTSTQSIDDARQNLLTTIRTNSNYATTTLDLIEDQYNDLQRVKDQNAKSNITWYSDLAQDKLDDLESILSKSDQSMTDSDAAKAGDLAIGLYDDLKSSLTNLFNAIDSITIDTRYSSTRVDANKAIVKNEQLTISANLATLQNFQQAYQLALLGYTSSIDTAQSSYDTAKANLDSALANKDLQLATAQSTLDNALGSYNLAKAQFDYKNAAPRNVDVAYYQAQVNQAQAALDLAYNNLNDNIIYAPTNGFVTFINYEVGEQIGVSATSGVITMLGNSEFEIDVDVPESDIIKVKVGNEAIVTLDAYSDDIEFVGKVIMINLAETNIQDVVYYKVKVELDPTEMEIKSGMTANVDILTAEKEDVISVPVRAVKENDQGEKYIEILKSGRPEKIIVETGMRGDDGLEIISGLKEGQEVITYIREE